MRRDKKAPARPIAEAINTAGAYLFLPVIYA
ncbi:hypothetical protein J2T14_001699 [Paenibacillus harenae]|nr:hypothetical protein [Paenibacillus harenae]